MDEQQVNNLLKREKVYEAIENPAGATSLLEVANRDPEDGVNVVEKQMDTISKTVDETYDKLDALKTQQAVANARPAMLADLQTTMGADISKTEKEAKNVLENL